MGGGGPPMGDFIGGGPTALGGGGPVGRGPWVRGGVCCPPFNIGVGGPGGLIGGGWLGGMTLSFSGGLMFTGGGGLMTYCCLG